MKLPSLIRLPNSKKFAYEPRFYDPVKEEIAERTERIRREMEAEAKITDEQRIKFKAEWQQVHDRRESEVTRSNVSQLVLILLLAFLSVGYLFYGNNVLYLGLILLPGYIFLRVRQMRNNS
jgi:hypothetical protein